MNWVLRHECSFSFVFVELERINSRWVFNVRTRRTMNFWKLIQGSQLGCSQLLWTVWSKSDGSDLNTILNFLNIKILTLNSEPSDLNQMVLISPTACSQSHWLHSIHILNFYLPIALLKFLTIFKFQSLVDHLSEWFRSVHPKIFPQRNELSMIRSLAFTNNEQMLELT
jgi:hypothetical protein